MINLTQMRVLLWEINTAEFDNDTEFGTDLVALTEFDAVTKRIALQLKWRYELLKNNQPVMKLICEQLVAPKNPETFGLQNLKDAVRNHTRNLPSVTKAFLP